MPAYLSGDAAARVRRTQLGPAAVQSILDAGQVRALVVLVVGDVTRRRHRGGGGAGHVT